MQTSQIKCLLAFVIVFAALFTSPIASHAADGFTYIPLEPIPGSEGAAKLPEYITGVYKFALWAVGIAAMFMITIGGAMYLTSAGNTSSLGNAKNVITDAIIGLVLALAAWFLLNLINPDILSGDLSIFNIVGGAGTPAATTTPSASTANTYTATDKTDAASLAQALLSKAASGGDCKDASGATVSPRSNLQQVTSSTDGKVTACNGTCKSGTSCTGTATLDVNLLRALNAFTSYSFSIQSLAGGQHTANSTHYQGNAADITLSGGTPTQYRAMRDAFNNGVGKTYGVRAQCDYNGSIQANCTSPNHLHVSAN